MRAPRDIQPLLDKLGLELLSLRTKRHLIMHLKNGHGICGTVTICKTPGDRRTRKNEIADLRRLARLTTLDLSGNVPDGGKKGQT